jgi:MoxR-like ATPase
MSIAASNPAPLLGREAEVELLVALLDGIAGGGGALVLGGEPGIGKSRLLAVAAALARERGFTVLQHDRGAVRGSSGVCGPASAASPAAGRP